MGITIGSKRYSCDMGYGGFNRFRCMVAKKINDEFYNHYMGLSSVEAMYSFGDGRKEFFKKYDSKTEDFIEKNLITIEVANFLYQSDCGGRIDRRQAKQIYELIKDCDDSVPFGYVGRADCTTMADMKKIFSDKTKVEWF